VASSSSYWSFAVDVKNELEVVFEEAKESYNSLESNDDPGELADDLSDILKRLNNLSARIAPAIAPLKKTAAALDSIPAFKG